MKVLIVNTFYYPHEVGGAEKNLLGIFSRGTSQKGGCTNNIPK